MNEKLPFTKQIIRCLFSPASRGDWRGLMARHSVAFRSSQLLKIKLHLFAARME